MSVPPLSTPENTQFPNPPPPDLPPSNRLRTKNHLNLGADPTLNSTTPPPKSPPKSPRNHRRHPHRRPRNANCNPPPPDLPPPPSHRRRHLPRRRRRKEMAQLAHHDASGDQLFERVADRRLVGVEEECHGEARGAERVRHLLQRGECG